VRSWLPFNTDEMFNIFTLKLFDAGSQVIYLSNLEYSTLYSTNDGDSICGVPFFK